MNGIACYNDFTKILYSYNSTGNISNFLILNLLSGYSQIQVENYILILKLYNITIENLIFIIKLLIIKILNLKLYMLVIKGVYFDIKIKRRCSNIVVIIAGGLIGLVAGRILFWICQCILWFSQVIISCPFLVVNIHVNS